MELLYVLWLLSNSNPIYRALVASVWSSDTSNPQNQKQTLVGRLAPAAILYIHEQNI